MTERCLVAVAWLGGHRSDAGDDEGGDCTTDLDGIDVLANGLGCARACSTARSVARKVTRLGCQTRAPDDDGELIGGSAHGALMAARSTGHRRGYDEMGKTQQLT